MASRLSAIALICLLPSSALLAQSANLGADHPARIKPDARRAVRSGASRTCAEFGPGFVMLEGTTTCVRVGGAVSIGVGGRANSGR